MPRRPRVYLDGEFYHVYARITRAGMRRQRVPVFALRWEKLEKELGWQWPVETRNDRMVRPGTDTDIVNLERVKEMQPWFNGEYVVILKDGTRVVMSRGYRLKLAHLFGSG